MWVMNVTTNSCNEYILTEGISIFQLMMFLVTNLECCREDSEILVTTLQTLLQRLHLDEENLPDDAAIKGLVDRNKQQEVFLLYLRFFNILMSRRKMKGEDNKVTSHETVT